MNWRTTARHVAAVVVITMLAGCTATQPNGSPAPVRAETPAPPAIDPTVAAYLAANNESFELIEPPATVMVWAARAIEIAAAETRGPIREARADFGLLRTNLGALPPPHAWLVFLSGPGFPPPAGTSLPPAPPSPLASQARASNLFFAWAFVDADRGTILIGSGQARRRDEG